MLVTSGHVTSGYVRTIMTHHDLISSYIDNELTAAQEQEFLISLAANDNLRSSFRTELTLKNIVHRDESLITPPRALRASVFAAVGLTAGLAADAAAPEAASAAPASAAPAPAQLTSTSSVATQSSSFFKTLFATKMNALFTTLSLSVATLVGFVGHDVIVGEHAAQPTVQTKSTAPSTTRVAEPAQTSETVAEKPVANSTTNAAKSSGSRIATRITKKPVTSTSNASEPTPQTDAVTDPSTTSGTGEVDVQPPVLKTPQK